MRMESKVQLDGGNLLRGDFQVVAEEQYASQKLFSFLGKVAGESLRLQGAHGCTWQKTENCGSCLDGGKAGQPAKASLQRQGSENFL